MQLLVIFSLILSAALCESGFNKHTSENGNDFTPESQAAQDYLQIPEEELPPIYIRHIPSPVKHKPIVPNVPVPSPQRISRQNGEDPYQVQASQNVYYVSVLPDNAQFGARTRESRQNALDTQKTRGSQNVYVVNAIPPHAQLGGRSLVVQHLPSHTEIKGEHVSNRIGRVEKIDFGERIFTPTVQDRRQVDQDRTTHYGEQQAQVQQVQNHIPVQKVGQFVQQPKTTSQDVHLVYGFTPEVYQATQEHLALVAAARQKLPHIEKQNR